MSSSAKKKLGDTDWSLFLSTYHQAPVQCSCFASVEESNHNPSKLNYFDLLPDELVLQIVKMASLLMIRVHSWSPGPIGGRRAISSSSIFKHDFILDVICEVSLRFRRVSQDRSLWKGRVCIHIRCQRKMDMIIECLNYDTKELQMYGNFISNPVHLFANHITACNCLQMPQTFGSGARRFHNRPMAFPRSPVGIEAPKSGAERHVTKGGALQKCINPRCAARPDNIFLCDNK